MGARVDRGDSGDSHGSTLSTPLSFEKEFHESFTTAFNIWETEL